jgi:hypothetical protein
VNCHEALRLKGLLVVCIGFIGVSIAIIPNTIFLFVDDPSYTSIRTIGSKLGLTFASIGVICILIGLHMLTGKSFKIYERFIMILHIFSLGLIFNDIKAERTAEIWKITYGDQEQFRFYSITIAIILIIVTYQVYDSYCRAVGDKEISANGSFRMVN